MSKGVIKAAILAVCILLPGMNQLAVAASSSGQNTSARPSSGTEGLPTSDNDILPAPLVAQGTSTPGQQKALDRAISDYQKIRDPAQTIALEAFLAQYPDAPWAVSLWLNIGLLHEQAGDYPAAVKAFKLALKVAGANPHQGYAPAQAPADQALAELLKIETGYAHADEVAALLADPRAKADGGVLTSQVNASTEALWTMRNKPQDAYRCGIIALERLLDVLHPHAPGITRLAQAKATANGMSLAALQQLAGAVEFHVQVVRVLGTATIPVPSLMHWASGHYITIVGTQADRYRVYDPAFNQEILISREVLEKNASGYFLVPQTESLSKGWRSVAPSEAAMVIGSGTPSGPNDNSQTGSDTPSSDNVTPGGNSSPNKCHGCAHYSVALMLASLRISDIPVSYKPPVGPTVEFAPVYNEQDASQPATPAYGNLGPQWSDGWLSYVEDKPSSIGANVTVVTAGGGYKTETGYSGSSSGGTYAPEERAATTLVLVSSSPIVYERKFSDGSMDVYSTPSCTSCSTRNVYLTKIVDPQGNALTLAYDSQLRLTTVTDAIGQQTTLQYTNSTYPLLLTSVTDPFGRSATLGYDSSGRLTSLTDAMGMQSSFVYNSGTNITSMTTPYGTTSYVFTPGSGSGQSYTYSLNITDPLGYTERYEYNQNSGTGYPPFSLPSSSSPTNWNVPAPAVTNIFNQYLYGRDIYHWDKATYAVPADQIHFDAVIDHFQHVSSDSNVQAAGVLEAVFNPLEGAIWYVHPGESSTGFTGTLDLPIQIGRILPGSPNPTQLQSYTYNTLGNVTSQTDPVGRVTQNTYASNNIDITEVQQKNGSSYDTLSTVTWNSQHEPLTVTDAAGETTTYTYNAVGQILTKKDALNNITTYAYADRTGAGSGNFLHTVTDANNQVVATYTYDTVGRIATYTDQQGYTLSYSYDNLDRMTQITYPDATTTVYAYSKLDLTGVTDRLGRLTIYNYDADRNLVSSTDPLGRTITYGYDPDGRLTSVTDPMGHKTTWTRDLEGRVTTKTYSDGTTTNYTYDIAGRLSTRTDALNQVTTYGYAADNHLEGKIYTNTVNPTPNVTYTWDAAYPYLDSMTDGSGPNGASETTTFVHWPVGQDGALQLAMEENSYSTTAEYLKTYDQLGRLFGRYTGGVTVVDSSLAYDAISRPIADGTAIGNFFYNYVGETQQMSSWYLNSWSEPVVTGYTYGTNAADRRLLQIGYPYIIVNGEVTVTDPGSGAGYQVGGIGRLTGRLLQTDTSGDNVYDSYSFDASDRLTKDIGYTYTPSGGYVLKYTQNFTSNDDDFLTYMDLPSLPLSVYSKWSATSKSNSDEINSITYTYPFGTPTYNYTYDADGNVLNDGIRSYTWDAENRLTSITNLGSGHATAFRYDGLDRRVAISETSGSTTTETDYLWCGQQLCADYAPSGSVAARYMPQGEAQYSGSTQTNLYYQRDHLGSVIGITDSSGNISGNTSYNSWGLLAYSGPRSTFMFAGMFLHQPSGLYLTLNRAYDPTTGRWLSRDPAGEFSGGSLNLYAYVGGNPINVTDRLGLAGGEEEDENLGNPAADLDPLVDRPFGAPPLEPPPPPPAPIPGNTGLSCPAPQDLYGKSMSDVRDMMNDRGWPDEPTSGEGGTRYFQPGTGNSNSVRTMPGNPNDPNPVKQGPYARISNNGSKTPPIPLKGNPTLNK